MKREAVHLGASSLVYMLKKEYFFMVSKTYIMLTLPGKNPYQVEIRHKNKKPVHCGYIVFDSETLKELFGDDTDSIKSFSERKSSGAFGIEHCSVRNDPKKRGTTLKTVDKEEFKCYYTPPIP